MSGTSCSTGLLKGSMAAGIRRPPIVGVMVMAGAKKGVFHAATATSLQHHQGPLDISASPSPRKTAGSG